MGMIIGMTRGYVWNDTMGMIKRSGAGAAIHVLNVSIGPDRDRILAYHAILVVQVSACLFLSFRKSVLSFAGRFLPLLSALLQGFFERLGCFFKAFDALV